MVARGDLGVEIPIEQVALAQKMMIHKCNVSGKFVITATQMLESMTINPSPTRAEVSDVANAVLDGTDCIMLSGETAKGKYPVLSVSMMSKICSEIESNVDARALFDAVMSSNKNNKTQFSISEAVAVSAVRASFDLNAKLLFVITSSGRTARLISKYRPKATIIAITDNSTTAQQLITQYGCFPIIVDSLSGSQSLLRRIMKLCTKSNLLDIDDIVIATVGQIEEKKGMTNEMIVLKVKQDY